MKKICRLLRRYKSQSIKAAVWKVGAAVQPRAVTFQQPGANLNIPTSRHSPVTLSHPPHPPPTPLPYKQSINMLFQSMMGKSMWEFSPPRSTWPSRSSATFLRMPLRTAWECGKDFQGLSWMWLNGKINDKHKKNKKVYGTGDGGCCSTFSSDASDKRELEMD